MRWTGAIACLIVTFASRASWAQPAAVAEEAFREGKRLMAKGDYTAACARFEESQHLDPAPGTQLNLGDCYEKAGRTASAWNAFVAAKAAAERAGQASRAEEANRRATSLEPRLSRIVITVVTPPPGIELRLDGNPLGALVSLGIPIDPGPHVVSATAAGYAEWSQRVEIARDAPSRTEVRVELVEAATPPPAPVAPGRPRGRRVSLLTWTLAGASVVALATGIGIDVAAYGDYRDCRDRGTCIDDAEVNRIERRMLVGDLLIGAGIASAAVGVTLYFLRDRDDRRLQVGVDPRSRTLQVTGAF
jgi:hypothetical protein